MAPNTNKEFDIIIFGATGYAGQYVIEELAHSSVSTNIKWAIAGRTASKLKESLNIVQGHLGETINIQGVTIIEADVKNLTSLNDMCKRAKLILNCVGPYKLYGEPVVQACIKNGTHHVDLSGEMKYLETIQAKYFDEARAKNVYIVGACGFDSIPGDYGISVVKQNFPGDLNSVEYYIDIKVGPSGRAYNTGTFESAVMGFHEHLKKKEYDKMLKEKLFKEDLPENKYPLSWRKPPVFYSPDMKSWCLWFMGPDERVIHRSQMFRHQYLKDRPVQSHGYLQTPSFFWALVQLFFMGIFGTMALFSFGRYLLTKYPRFFTAGIFSPKGPTRQQVVEGSVTITLIGEGWKDKLLDPNDQHNTKPDTKLKVTMTGPELCYPLTAMCLVQAGITILEEPNNMPLEGGVLSPGVAFEKTSLRQRLEKRGATFKFETY